MIEVSVEPDRLVVGQRSRLCVKFANTGRRPCRNITFNLRLPAGLSLRGGQNRVQIPEIGPGRVHAHEVTVEPSRPGSFELTSPSFQYRDERDRLVQVTDFRVRLTAEAALPSPRISLQVDKDVLRVLVENRTGVRLSEITVAVNGLGNDAKQPRIQALEDGKTGRFSFSRVVRQPDPRTLLTVLTTYSYPDGLGTRRRTQEDKLKVPAASREASAAKTTRSEVFVCYSHADEDKWLTRVETHLKPLERQGIIKLWSDRNLSLGDRWRAEIEAALASARVALLLVTPDFMASDFIQKMELPELLRAADEGGCRIIPILVKPSMFIDTPSLTYFQYVPRGGMTLSEMTAPQVDRVLLDVARSLKADFPSD